MTPRKRSCGTNKLRVHVSKSSKRRGYYKCTPDKGTKGRAKKIFSVRKGRLHPYRLTRRDNKSGYLSADSRRSLLRKTRKRLIPRKDWNDIGRSLNALYIYNKNANPTVAAKAKADRDWAFKQATKEQSK